MLSKENFNEWKARVEKILTKVEIPWEIHLLEDKIFQNQNGNGRLYIQIQFNDMDNMTGEQTYRAFCRKWYLSPHMTDQELIRTCWLAYRGAVLHEAQEKFKYKGKMIYGPHMDPEYLVSIADQRMIRENHAK